MTGGDAARCASPCRPTGSPLPLHPRHDHRHAVRRPARGPPARPRGRRADRRRRPPGRARRAQRAERRRARGASRRRCSGRCCRARCRWSPGLDLAAQYLPASSGSDVGGDFYDVLPSTRARWLVAIGDVCGKGAGAAARTGLVRDVLRVLVRDGRPLVGAVELLNEVMMEAADPLQFCTLAAAIVRRPAMGGPGPGRRAAAGRAPAAACWCAPTAGPSWSGEHGTAVGLVPRLMT